MLNVAVVKPASLRELWGLLPSLPAAREYLAGGTDIIPRRKAGAVERRAVWVDISGLKELAGIGETKNSIVIGAGVRISELGYSEAVRRHLPVLASAIPHFASPSLRNMETIGGNAANASPCADGACALCAERAEVHLVSPGGKRRMPLTKFFLGPKKTALKRDELITAFEAPKWRHSGAYFKLGPRAYFGISKVSVAAALEMSGKEVKAASIALASVAPVPLAASKASASLVGRVLDAESIRAAAALVKTEVSPISDVRSEALYRREMAGVLLKRALTSIGDGS